jgi:ribosomal protein L11 methyltransferase
LSTQDLIEVSLDSLDDAAAEAVGEVFDRWGWGGAVIEMTVGDKGEVRSAIKTYVAAQDAERLRKIEIGLALLNRVRATRREPPIPLPQLRTLAETDWAEAWKAHYTMLRIGRRMVVKPTWQAYDARADDVVIEMDPGMAFGSGLHATTRLCLEMLEGSLRPGASVLDIGTGSGILAIAAGKLGASRVLALDTDPVAVQVARDNVRLNRLDGLIDVRAGTLALGGVEALDVQVSAPPPRIPGLAAELPPHLGRQKEAGVADSYTTVQAWDVILANILAETIVDLAPALAANLAAGGALIASGIIRERIALVIDSLGDQGLRVVERREDGEWVALKAQR